MRKSTSPRVALAINKMYAEMATAAAKKAVAYAKDGAAWYPEADRSAKQAEIWAKRAGGNALHWGLGI